MIIQNEKEAAADALLAAWRNTVEALSAHLSDLALGAGKPCELDVYSSHALGAKDRDMLAAVLRALLAHVVKVGIEPSAARQSQRKAKTAHVAVTVDYVNGWFFVRSRDDGGSIKPDSVYRAGTAIYTEITALHAIGGHFTVERASGRGTSYTFSWERMDQQISELTSELTTASEAAVSAA